MRSTRLHYLWGGFIASLIIAWHAYKLQSFDWAFCTAFLGYLAYHAGIHAFEKFIDKWSGPK